MSNNVKYWFVVLTIILSANMQVSKAYSFKASVTNKETREAPPLLTGHEFRRDLYKEKPTKKNYFPEKSYTIPAITFKIDDSKSSPAVADYDYLVAQGVLNLIFFDKKTGFFKYSLTLKPISIIKEKINPVSGSFGKRISGDIKFDDNRELVTFIEGKLQQVGDEIILSNFNIKDKSNSSFILEKFSSNKNDVTTKFILVPAKQRTTVTVFNVLRDSR